jgi:hypothetical protein
MGGTTISNGRLLALASQHFDVFVTVDRNLSFQQKLPSFSIAVIAAGEGQPACRSQAVGPGLTRGDRFRPSRDRNDCWQLTGSKEILAAPFDP